MIDIGLYIYILYISNFIGVSKVKIFDSFYNGLGSSKNGLVRDVLCVKSLKNVLAYCVLRVIVQRT